MTPMPLSINCSTSTHGREITVCLPRLQVAVPEVEQAGAEPLTRQTIPVPQEQMKPAPRFKVILLNDDYHMAEYVAQSLVKAVTSLSEQDAWRITVEAHQTGKAIVIVCHQEAAEFYQERLQSYGLTITVEPE